MIADGLIHMIQSRPFQQFHDHVYPDFAFSCAFFIPFLRIPTPKLNLYCSNGVVEESAVANGAVSVVKSERAGRRAGLVLSPWTLAQWFEAITIIDLHHDHDVEHKAV